MKVIDSSFSITRPSRDQTKFANTQSVTTSITVNARLGITDCSAPCAPAFRRDTNIAVKELTPRIAIKIIRKYEKPVPRAHGQEIHLSMAGLLKYGHVIGNYA